MVSADLFDIIDRRRRRLLHAADLVGDFFGGFAVRLRGQCLNSLATTVESLARLPARAASMVVAQRQQIGLRSYLRRSI